jgi:hypothetical protein
MEQVGGSLSRVKLDQDASLAPCVVRPGPSLADIVVGVFVLPLGSVLTASSGMNWSGMDVVTVEFLLCDEI